MPAYALLEFTIHDPAAFDAYRKVAPATVAAFEGKFIVRGGPTLTVEGEWNPERLVIIQFPSYAQAKAWWESPAYTEAIALRKDAVTAKVLIAEGWANG